MRHDSQTSQARHLSTAVPEQTSVCIIDSVPGNGLDGVLEICIGICVGVVLALVLELVASASIWQYLGSSGSIWDPLAASGSIWRHLAASGTIWAPQHSDLAAGAHKSRSFVFRGSCQKNTSSDVKNIYSEYDCFKKINRSC